MKNTTILGLAYIGTAFASIILLLGVMPKILVVPLPLTLLLIVENLTMATHGLEKILKDSDPVAARRVGSISNACFIISMLLAIPAIIALVQSEISFGQWLRN